jgi:energy-coupling factor transporter ATP-binding protein EcfA2
MPGDAPVDATLPRIARAQITRVFGPKGCGKSTLINRVAGLLPFDRGAPAVGRRIEQLASNMRAPAPEPEVLFLDAPRPRDIATPTDPGFVTAEAHPLTVFQREVRKAEGAPR